MNPKLDRAFHALPSEQRLFYLTGMPRSHVTAPMHQPFFLNVKLSETQALSSAAQKEKYLELGKSFPPDTFSVFASYPSDQDALSAASILVKQYIQSGIKNIEYVLPSEYYPRDHDKFKELYVVMGVHEDDKDLVHHVRRWIRAPLGVPRFLILTSANPYQWCLKKLGCTPDFLFVTRQVGQING